MDRVDAVIVNDAALKLSEMAPSAAQDISMGDVSPASKWQHPPSFYCPISQQVMHDPVVLSDGHTYERRHIDRWLKQHSTSPVSNEVLSQKTIFPNHALRNAIEEYFQQVFSVHRRAIRRTIAIPDSKQCFGSNAALLRTIDALMQCSFLMNADLNTECVLRQIMDEAKMLLGAEVASVFLVDSTNQELYSTVNSTGGELRIPITAGIAGHVASTGEPVIIRDAYSDPRFNKTNDIQTGFRTRNMMCVPLKVKNNSVIGVVQVINKTNVGVFCRSQRLARLSENGESDTQGFTAQDLQFLLVFANQAATAVANSGGMEYEPSPQVEDVEEATSSFCDPFQFCMGRPKVDTIPKSQMLGVKRTTCSKTGEEFETTAIMECFDTAVVFQKQASPFLFDMRPHLEELKLTMLTKATQSWQFDAFALAEVTENRPLSTLGIHLFHYLGLIEHLDLDADKLTRFFTQIEQGYDNANPYHNAAHAASVLHSMYALLQHGGLAKATSMACEELKDCTFDSTLLVVVACLMAAAVHDFEHLGLSNDFLVRAGHGRALKYNDQHVNEHHHVAAAFAVLLQPECDFLSTRLPLGIRMQLRKLIIELVIGTDMANGGKILKSFSDAFDIPAEVAAAAKVPDSLADPQPPVASAKDAVLLLQVAMKCADLGHLALGWNLHVQWVKLLEAEFFAQGDKEKELGHPVSFLMDREKPGCSETQLGFFQFVVLPLYQSLAHVVRSTQPMLDAVLANYHEWQRLASPPCSVESDTSQCTTSCHVSTKESDEPLSSQEVVRRGRPASSIDSEAVSSQSNTKRVSDASPSLPMGQKRSGRARQRAAKWWATVRRRTPSPDI